MESKPTGDYRKHLPDTDIPRFTQMRKQDAHEYVKDFKTHHVPPWLYGLYEHWRYLWKEPFRGVTNDGARMRSQLSFTTLAHSRARCGETGLVQGAG